MYKLKDKTISLRISAEEYYHLKQVADCEKVKMSAYIRKLIEEKKDPAADFQPDLPQDL